MNLYTLIEMLDFEFVFFAVSGLAFVASIVSLFIWSVIVFLYIKEMDVYFYSEDFPYLGYKGLWPWQMSRATSYGVFLLFPNSKYVRKQYPNACENIEIINIPRKIKFMAAFPIFTVYPPWAVMMVGGVWLYIKKWFF